MVVDSLMSIHYYLPVLKLIESRGFQYIQLDKSTYRLNNKINLIFRYSKLQQKSAVPHYWFGIPRKKLESYPADNLFLVLICGSEKHVFIIPGNYFKKLLRNVNTATDDNWKFNIYNRDNTFQLWVTGKPLLDIHKFLNNYDLLNTSAKNQDVTGVHPDLLFTCPETGARLLRRLGEKCEATGVLCAPDGLGKCHATGQRVRRSLLATDEITGLTAQEKLLRPCERTGKKTAPANLARSQVSGALVSARSLGSLRGERSAGAS
ncbi:MAG: hypothetical protein QHH75_14330 [Bacillota bacterium]|nr:hypothetical protein [Bacillota bacterium]